MNSMDYNKLVGRDDVSFGDMHPGQFLLGMLSAFENAFQAKADSFFEEITWKQFFAIICINLCQESPTINELSDVMESSHQNVKQILLKLEKVGFVEIRPDEKDRRKQRIYLTPKCGEFCAKNEEGSRIMMQKLFDGIDREQFYSAIEVIGRMERNLKDM